MTNLRKIRKAKGFTVRQCAEAVGVSHQRWTRWEGLRTEPDWDKAIKAARYLGVSLDELAGNDAARRVAL